MTTPADAATSQPVIQASAPGGRAPDILRRLLAVVAPIPMVAMGTFYLISPFPGDAPLPEQVAVVPEKARRDAPAHFRVVKTRAPHRHGALRAQLCQPLRQLRHRQDAP